MISYPQNALILTFWAQAWTNEYTFACDFGTATMALLHVDGHLVCSTGVNSPGGGGVGHQNAAKVITYDVQYMGVASIVQDVFSQIHVFKPLEHVLYQR